jgi:hypothetical protein
VNAILSNINNRTRLPKLGVVRLGVKDGSGRPQEVGHFILDIEDSNLRSNAQALYGDKPKALDITFFSDRIEDVFRCTLQRWVKDKQGTSRLMCEGTGIEAVEGGRMRSCPCPALGSGCQKKTVLKFLIPRLTIGGYFLMPTRSDNNADNIETSLKLLKRTTGGLMSEMRLKRTEGYATVNGVRTRKFYVAVEGHLAMGPAMPASAVPSAVKPHEETSAKGQRVAGMTSLGTLLQPPDACTLARQEELRLRDGRGKVREKIRLFIMEPGAEAAAEQYSCIRFSKKSFEDLSVDQLLELWHSIDDETTLGDIYTIFLANQRGLPEVQRG